MEQSEIFRELIGVIRARANARVNAAPDESRQHLDDSDDAELFKSLARMVEGKSVYEAFGSPGGWGYGTPIGDALKAGYSRPGSNPTRAVVN